jgi:predicted ATPase
MTRAKKTQKRAKNAQARMDAEAILTKLTEIRRSIPNLKTKPRPENKSLVAASSLEDFEDLAVIEALESLADDVHASVEEARQRAYEQALEVYYAAEELARDPEHADLIPQVEAMREAHQSSYGRPVPPKKK